MEMDLHEILDGMDFYGSTLNKVNNYSRSDGGRGKPGRPKSDKTKEKQPTNKEE
jgi:hypothetical protein